MFNKEKKKKSKENALDKNSTKKAAKKEKETEWKTTKVSSVRTTAKLLPFKQIFKNVIKFKDNTYLDILRIVTQDLENLSKEDFLITAGQIQKLMMMYSDDIKIIGINFPTNTKKQQRYFRHKINYEENPERKYIQTEKLRELEDIEKQSTDREYFLFIYGKNYDELLDNRSIVLSTLDGAAHMVEEIQLYEKIQCLSKMTNKSTIMFNDEKLPEKIFRDDNEQQIAKNGYDSYFLEMIQPRGGISFEGSDYIRTGDGYEACLTINDYPESVDRFWLTYIMNISGAVTVLDFSTMNKEKVKRALNRSIAEQKSRYKSAKNFDEENEAENKFEKLINLFREIDNMGEVIKAMTARIYLSAQTKDELDGIRSDIKHYLDSNGFLCGTNLNEQEFEWQSMFLSKTMQDTVFSFYKRQGQPLTTETIAGGNPFHFSSLNDTYGSYFGKTIGSSESRGNIILDTFHMDNRRIAYNGVVIGFMGSGKSTLLKKIIRDRFGRGDYIRVIDVVGDFIPMAKVLGGKVVSLDGTSGVINPLQINGTMIDEKTMVIDEKSSYASHMSTVKNMYRFMAPDCDENEVMYFETLVTDLYVECGLIPASRQIEDGVRVTGLPNDTYPILSDLLLTAEKRYHDETNENSRIMCRNIILVLSSMVNTHGKIFNGHTSVDNLLDEQFVVYDCKNLAHQESSVFDAQLFSGLTTSWANAVRIGMQEKQKVEEGEIEAFEARKFLLILDESHKTINANKPYAVQQIMTMEREGRKFFAGILLASQSISDYVPDGTSTVAEGNIRTLFTLSQYKFIFRQDSSTLEKLIRIFGNTLTPTEIDSIPYLQKGECVLTTGDVSKNVSFKVYCTDEELDMFRGGV